MNKIDYSTQPKEKGIDNYVWVLETKIKLAENDIEALKKDLILDVNEDKFEKLQYYSFELNRLKIIKTELRNSLTILRVNLKKIGLIRRTQEMKSLYINDSYKGKCHKWNKDDLLMYLYIGETFIAIPLKYDVSLKETDNRIDVKVCRN